MTRHIKQHSLIQNSKTSTMSSEHLRQERAAHYAEALRERFETQGMLAELAEYPNFVVWRYTVVDGQRKKPPFNPNTNYPASPTNAATWGTLESALDALATGKYQGIGFMLSHSPFSGIDLDHCINDGTLQPWRKRLSRHWIPTPSIPHHSDDQQD